ncbi:SpoIIE family protein phosphatase [Streptomyces sp. Je 1-79]|uniref:SpoIIE family protein phosphatase n=1 Tax=Streptomyces sp. Je 1-79 TaxID=2943847 RepID=UPI0021A57EA3|nr:SpoIIE family protein phosphatase [Streptomyces sp. Je 1-79]MCT4351991.1 SpoIIE family protein phosphatase [Streptomyces sp. Je 1-79]
MGRPEDTDSTAHEAVFGVADSVVLLFDERGAVVGRPYAAERLLGYPAAELGGRSVDALLAGDETARLPGILETAVRDGGWSGVLLARHRDGRAVAVDVTVLPLPGDTGPARWLVVAVGAAPSRQWTMGPALLERMVTQMPVGLCLVDTELRCVWSNTALEHFGGGTVEQRRGKRLAEIQPGINAELVESKMRQVLTTGEPVVGYEHVGRTRSLPGRDHAHAMSFVRLDDDNGRALGVCYAVVDITDRYRARLRLALMARASERIGRSLDVLGTAQDLADVAVPGLADFVAVDLLDTVLRGAEPSPGPTAGATAVRLVRAGVQTVRPGGVKVLVEPGEPCGYLPSSPQIGSLAHGRSWRAAHLDASTREAGLPLPMARPTGASEPTGPKEPTEFAEPTEAKGPTEPSEATEFAESTEPAASTEPVDPAGLTEESAAAYSEPHTAIVVPILSRGITLGVATFFRTRRDEAFDEDDLRLAEEIVARAAVCLDNARRYARERAAALVLQRSLLPHGVPVQEAVHAASFYRPADELSGLGGDWFDVILLSGARVALVVGEVLGHGIDAAATMGQLRTAVRTLADLDLSPEELLAHLDDLVVQVTREGAESDLGPANPAGVGASCLYAVYDPVSLRCELASAGHLAPAVLAPDGTVTFPELPPGPALGVGGLPFESVELPLAEGTVLAFFTDGLIAAPGAGVEGLRQILESRDLPLDELCRSVVDELAPSRPYTDDAALLLVRTRGLAAGQVAVWELPADPAVVARARVMAARQLAAWGLEELAFTTELVVSELVTNAIRHASGPIRLRLILERTLICEVFDASSTSPHLRHARTTDEGGRGLFLISQFTRRWGTRYTAEGKVIWAEQPLDSDSTAPPTRQAPPAPPTGQDQDPATPPAPQDPAEDR